jgi:hypothetical protein
MTIDHAIDLARTHGTSYASRYLRNHRIDEETIQRIVFGNWTERRLHTPPAPVSAGGHAESRPSTLALRLARPLSRTG